MIGSASFSTTARGLGTIETLYRDLNKVLGEYKTAGKWVKNSVNQALGRKQRLFWWGVVCYPGA